MLENPPGKTGPGICIKFHGRAPKGPSEPHPLSETGI